MPEPIPAPPGDGGVFDRAYILLNAAGATQTADDLARAVKNFQAEVEKAFKEGWAFGYGRGECGMSGQEDRDWKFFAESKTDKGSNPTSRP